MWMILKFLNEMVVDWYFMMMKTTLNKTLSNCSVNSQWAWKADYTNVAQEFELIYTYPKELS